MSASDENSGLKPAEGDAARGAPSPRLEELFDALEERAEAGGVREQAWGRGLHQGAVIGRFELLREIGRGSSGVVWEARDRELGRTVAFKAVTADWSLEPRRERLLQSEAEAAAQLSHPNIVELLDLGLSDYGPYLILELPHGETLGERLEKGPLPLRDALGIGVEVAKGLAHAHAQGIVHRDLTPDNVFLCDDGRVVLLEFAGSHVLVPPRSPSSAAAYTAPEQWQGDPGDPRTDVFALGVILFEMLSGELPFPDDGSRAGQGDRPAARLELTQEARPGWLARLRRVGRSAYSFMIGRHASEEPGDLVARMLEKDRVNRPQSMKEVLAVLTRLQKEAPRSVSVAVHASSSESQPGGCGAFEKTLEEVAFRGQEPKGDLHEHLASCRRCADRLESERALYRMPAELKTRVLEGVALEALFGPSPDAKASRAQRMLQAVRDALSPASRRQPADGLESRIRKASAAGDPTAAATEAIRGLGPSVLGYLRGVLRNEEDAKEAFSQWAETLWREASTYRGQLSFRVWALQLAWRKALKLRERSYHKRAALPGSGTAETAAITDDVYVGSLFPEGKFAKLLESLTAEERSLLMLRLDMGLSWNEIARVMAHGGKPARPAALSKHFEQLKARLSQLASDQGLLR